MTPLASTITPAEFKATLERYDDAIAAATRPKPEPLNTLDAWRRTELPTTIASRSPPHMTKAEVYRLVDCKLKRGKNRPILRLIEANTDDTVISTTTTAFASLKNPSSSSPYDDDAGIRRSFSALLTLKGVGPATASFLLAAHAFPRVPAFSDEAFRWIVRGGDWSAKIKYDAAEYWELFDGVGEVAKRLGVAQEDVERVGFVLGQEGVRGQVLQGNGKGKAGVKMNGKATDKGGKEKMAVRGKKKREAVAVAEAEEVEEVVAEEVRGTKKQPSAPSKKRKAGGDGGGGERHRGSPQGQDQEAVAVGSKENPAEAAERRETHRRRHHDHHAVRAGRAASTAGK